ncbi:hypothetical protein CC78DRAFT_612648 [Lojkania enalia]|uniref:Rhodopsin domain-containing protein n=1 Tax=Lojkania enalia TaxID=147567 RepID=A0A9P4N9P8_9PLEO|nr:hypothetical protein CC78DRAFT_612648 [Didymosphaeria enalia]
MASLQDVDFSTLSPEFIELLLTMPAASVPPGADSRLISHPSRTWWQVTVILCSILSGIFVLLRAYTKLVVIKSVDAADYFILIGFFFLLSEVIIGHWASGAGSGVHQWQLTVAQLFDLLYWMNIAEIVYGPTTFFAKMSVILQYIKVFAPKLSPVNRPMFFASRAVIIISALAYTIMMFYMTFYCTPRSLIWNKLQPGKCLSVEPAITASPIFNIIIDVVMLLLPIMSLLKLQIATKKKVHISLLFGTGIVATVASIIRIIYAVRTLKPNADISYLTLGLGLWSYAEITLVLIASSAFTLPKLIKSKQTAINSAFSFFHIPFSSIGSFMSKSSSNTELTANKGTLQEGGWKIEPESKEYIVKSMHFETTSEEAWQLYEGGDIRVV